MTRVGILGSAGVGQTLAKGFKAHGYEVRIGSRSPEKLAAFSAAEHIPSGTFADVAEWADTLVLAVSGGAAHDALALAGNLSGKIVMDATNPISGPPVDGVLPFFTAPNTSLMEALQAAHPAARFVKVFSSVGAARMVNPSFAEGRPTMFICGNDASAKADVTHLLAQFGWDAADLGTAHAAGPIEALCQAWCILGFRDNSWGHAFKLLRA